MNKSKWKDKEVPFGILVAKLAEETGEVAADYSDCFFFHRDYDAEQATEDISDKVDNLVTELQQVRFLAGEMLKRIEADGIQAVVGDWA